MQTGFLHLNGSYPEEFQKISETTTTYLPYDRSEHSSSTQRLLFPTQSDSLPSSQVDLLGKFLLSVAASQR